MCYIFPCTVKKSTAQVDRKALNMRHQSYKGFQGISVKIKQILKCYLINVPITRKIVSSNDIVFDETFSSASTYTPHPYSEEAVTQPAILLIPYDISSHEKTGDIITFAQFEEGDLLENEQKLVEDELVTASIDDSSAYDNSDDESISMDTLKDIQDRNHVHPNISARDAIFIMHEQIGQAQSD